MAPKTLAELKDMATRTKDRPTPAEWSDIFDTFYTGVVSVQAFDAKGDGVTDDTAAINAAVTKAQAAGGGTIYFPRGTYRIGGAVTINSNRLRFAGEGELSIIEATAAGAWLGRDSTKPVRTALDANADKGDITVTLPSGDGANFAVGEFLGLESSDAGFGVAAATNRAAEEHKIMGISGDVLTLDSPLIFDYTTANSAEWYNASDDFITDIKIEGLSFTTSDASSISVQTLNLRGIHRLMLDDIYIYDAGGAILLRGCHDVQATNILVDNLYHLGSSFAYGFFVGDNSSDVEITNYNARDTRHAFTTLGRSDGANFYGGPRNVTLTNCHGKNSNVTREATEPLAIWDTHAQGDNIQFNGCTSIQGSSNAGNQIRARNVQFNGGHHEGGFRTFDIQVDSQDTSIRNLTTFTREPTAASVINVTNVIADSHVIIENVSIPESTSRGIDANTTAPKLTIVGNDIRGCVADPIRMGNNTKSHIAANRIEQSGSAAVAIENVGDGTTVQGNDFVGYDLVNVLNNSSGVGYSGNFMDGQPINEGGHLSRNGAANIDHGLRGTLFTNDVGTFAFAHNLPPAIVGQKYSFQRVASHNFSLNPSGSEAFRGQTAGFQLNLVSDFTRADIWCVVAGTWEFQIYQGTAFAVVTTDYTFTA